ncbi:Uu.00g056650.m01.CDS01 [Anthostomella pinea]|uniref:Uu.00g056650.m01.CDS01 n=1 Tax=Anthostomella pinea TaxID=933095 RepID=A0AAI8VRJ2_9PEZI|nr:Uu.00g056650.m01.CDS01 [Anthostomella pinea]
MEHEVFAPQTVQADVYFFRMAFRNWNDKTAVNILKAQIPGLRPGVKLLIQDACMREPGTAPISEERVSRAIDMSLKTFFNTRERLVTEDISDILEDKLTSHAVSQDEATRWVLDIVDKPRWEELGLKTDAQVRWVDVAFGLQRVARDDDPSGQVNGIDIFHAIPLKAVASSREVWVNEHLSRWADFSLELLRFHAVDGAHYTMIGPEQVASFAQILIGALKARGI